MDTGNTRVLLPERRAVYGLSPWIRGTPWLQAPRQKWLRFIPVDTGNTWFYFIIHCKKSVYPRGYGEHISVLLLIPYRTGLSPWIRGTLFFCRLLFLVSRFIPVDTGNTTKVVPSLITSTVYPRGYGEHTAAQMAMQNSGGLSPWIRGTQVASFVCTLTNRFIPVDTGNTVV